MWFKKKKKNQLRRQIDNPRDGLNIWDPCESSNSLMSFWGAGGKTSSWRWRGFNKTTNRGAGKDEERADRTLFHLLNLIMEIRNISDCFAAYVFVPPFRCVYMCVSAADDWGWREIRSSTACRTRAVTVALWFSDVYLMPGFYSFVKMNEFHRRTQHIFTFNESHLAF